jgi:3-deoxy-manno-octulosonate cytidylyltransferase (CMP-KDO synthetase)
MDTPKVLGIIPARLNSSRIKEKMIVDICGKPLIEWTIERTKKASSLTALVVATDAPGIARVVEKLNVPVIMTAGDIKCGTDRAAAALKEFKDFTPDIVVVIWGDEPLYPAEAIDRCVELLAHNPDVVATTLADRITKDEMWRSPSVVKVLTDLNDYVLGFSRAPVPFPHRPEEHVDVYHVTGAMAVRPAFLETFVTLPQTPLERREGVEQWRILEHGFKMKVAKGDFENLGVNEPHELEEVRRIIAARLTPVPDFAKLHHD